MDQLLNRLHVELHFFVQKPSASRISSDKATGDAPATGVIPMPFCTAKNCTSFPTKNDRTSLEERDRMSEHLLICLFCLRSV